MADNLNPAANDVDALRWVSLGIAVERATATLPQTTAGALFTVAVGLLMGGLFRTTMQVNTWASFVMLGLMAPSWFTALVLPTPVEQILRLIPTHYLTQALGLSLAGKASLARVGGHLAALAGSTIVVLAAVVWTLRREKR